MRLLRARGPCGGANRGRAQPVSPSVDERPGGGHGHGEIPPRLAEAHYQAVLLDGVLYGAGRWQVTHPGPEANLLNLGPCNLALQRLPHYVGGSRANQPALVAERVEEILPKLLEAMRAVSEAEKQITPVIAGRL